MVCIKCGSTNCQIINEVHIEGKVFSASEGCCGAMLLGPIGVLCGACGAGRRTKNKNCWVCNNCGHKWRT